MNKYLKQLLDALAQKNAEKQGIVTKALDAGQTPNEEEEKQIEGIDAEIATLEKNIARVKEMIAQGEKLQLLQRQLQGKTHKKHRMQQMEILILQSRLLLNRISRKVCHLLSLHVQKCLHVMSRSRVI